MKRLFVFVLVLILMAACTSGQVPPGTDNRTAESSGIVVSARTDRTIAALDETIRFTLTASCPQHVQLRMPEIGVLIAGLRIVDFGETGPDLIDNRLIFEKWFDLRADLSGAYIIPSMTVRAVDHEEIREISTPQIFIKVGGSGALSDNATMQDIIDIKDPVVPPRNLKPFILGAFVVIVLIVFALFVWRYVRKRRAAVTATPKPAHVLAYEQLDLLENKRLVEKGIVQEYYVRLSDIFRHYLQNRFAIFAVEQTTQELLRSITGMSDMSSAAKNQTQNFLLHADLVKFAKYLPEKHDMQHSQQQVRNIIDQTRQEPSAVEQQLSEAGRPGEGDRQ